MATIRTLAAAALNSQHCTNKKAQLDDFADDFDKVIAWMKKINFL